MAGTYGTAAAGAIAGGGPAPQSRAGARVDAAATLASSLAVQNGIYRVVEDYSAFATYLFFTFQYAVEPQRIARRAEDVAKAEPERSRLRATEANRVAKLEDLRRKYSLRLPLDLAAVLTVRAPARRISVRLIREQERLHALVWNPVLKMLELPLCESCWALAHPLYLCERVPWLCRECWAQCPACARFFCRACQPGCKCGIQAT